MGGQGAVMGALILAEAAFDEGKYAQFTNLQAHQVLVEAPRIGRRLQLSQSP